MMALEGASAGLQLGGEETDFVLLLISDKFALSVLSSKVKLGGDVSAAAGPVGREASADGCSDSEILSYSRAKGLFGGVSLEGSTLRADNDANKDICGKKIDAKDIVFNGVLQPPSSGNKTARNAGQVNAGTQVLKLARWAEDSLQESRSFPSSFLARETV
jgi:lipid-binding SYLF domain-containing protein